MAFKPVEKITIDGSNKAFGGYVYNVNFDVSLEPAPSKLTLHFVSEDGTYQEPQLSTTSPYRIEIGNMINDNFYAISYTENKGSGGRTLEVTFYDGSIILDNIWVGLHKIHGTNPSVKAHISNLSGQTPNPYPSEIYSAENNPSDIIVLGTEQHPCDIDENGVFDKADVDLLSYPQDDPCQIKCAGEDADSNPLLNDCLTKAKTQIFTVNYTFSELLDAVGKRIKIRKKPELGDLAFYRADTAGTLRSVLTSWCEELGYTFYWEDDGLNFVDITKRPKVEIPNFECVDSSSRTKTLEGTVRRGCISHYSSEGQIIDKDCKEGKKISLHCLTLRDLYTDVWKPSYEAGSTGYPEGTDPQPSGPNIADDEYKDDVYPNGIPVEKLEEAVICAKYDRRLRMLCVLRDYYGLKDIPQFILAKGLSLDRFGGMKIFKVLDREGKDTDNPSALSQYSELVKNNSILKPTERSSFEKYKGFFIIAKIDIKKLEDQYSFEQKLADAFLGRHWIRAYHSPFYGEDPEMTPSCQYLGASSAEVRSELFTTFRHDNESKVAVLAQKLKITQKPSPDASPLRARREIDQNRKSLIYYSPDDTDKVWHPSSENLNYFKALLDKVDEAMPRVCTGASSDMLKSILKEEMAAGTITNDDIETGRIQLLAMFPGNFTISSEFGNNPRERDRSYAPLAQFQSIAYGLSSKRCAVYNIWGVTVHTPAAASCIFDAIGSSPLLDNRNPAFDVSLDLSEPISANAPSFGVIVSPTRTAHVEIPKVEVVMVTPAPQEGALVTDYLVREQMDQNSLRLLNNMQGECIPDLEILQSYHREFNEGLTFNVLEPFESQEFTVAGIDLPSSKRLGIGQGLEAFTIRIDSKGVFSTYSIGNRKFVPISPNVLIKRLEFKLKNAIARNGPKAFSNAQAPAYT